MKLHAIIRILQMRHYHSAKPSLAHTRERVLFNILLVASLVGMVAYIPSVWGALAISYYDTAIIDTIMYAWILYLLTAKHMAYRKRAYGLIVPIWILSFYLIVRFGLYGAGFLWLFTASVLTGILLGLKEGMGFLIASIILFTLFISAFSDTASVETMLQTGTTIHWFVMAGNLLMLIVLVMVSSSVMVDALTRVIEKLDRKIKALSDTEDATIETFAVLAECRDADTGYHIERTKAYVRIIAQTLKKHSRYKHILSDEYIERLYKSAPLHDIGKIGIPDSILLKKDMLTPQEMEVMKLHTVYGRDALLRSQRKLGENSFLSVAAEIAYTHQERWDGSGYPQGLKGEEIPLSGRIMAIADVYDALRSERPYKNACGHQESIEYLRKNGGILFDPEIIALLPKFEDELKKVYEEKAARHTGCRL